MLGAVYGGWTGPLSETAREAISRHFIVFLLKITVLLYGQTGWPGWRDLVYALMDSA